MKLSLGFAWFALALAVTMCGGGGEGGTNLGPTDPRCQSLCPDRDGMCSSEAASCQSVCQVRVANMSATCATCLLEGSNGGTCDGGSTCCPHASFRQGVVDCAQACATSQGVNPAGDHPICTSICSHADPACSDKVAQCFAECRARIRGVSGICALCLLDDAHGGACGGSPCCPDPVFPTSANTCAPFCR